jgi:hypothetical protein
MPAIGGAKGVAMAIGRGATVAGPRGIAGITGAIIGTVGGEAT